MRGRVARDRSESRLVTHVSYSLAGVSSLCAPGLTWLQIGLQYTGTIDR